MEAASLKPNFKKHTPVFGGGIGTIILVKISLCQSKFFYVRKRNLL